MIIFHMTDIKKCMVNDMTRQYDDIVTAINKVLKDHSIDVYTKLVRIEAYIEVYISNNTQSMQDME